MWTRETANALPYEDIKPYNQKITGWSNLLGGINLPWLIPPLQLIIALPGVAALPREPMGWEEGTLGSPHPSLPILALPAAKAEQAAWCSGSFLKSKYMHFPQIQPHCIAGH